MPIFRWGHHWDALGDLEREVDRLLRSVHIPLQGLRFGRQYPAINLYELDDEYLLTAELPGIRASEVDVSVAEEPLGGERGKDPHLPAPKAHSPRGLLQALRPEENLRSS